MTFVLRCQFERIATGAGAQRSHFLLEEIGAGQPERPWRSTELEAVIRRLRDRIALAQGTGGPPN